MKLIKFRGQGSDGCWYYGDLVHFSNSIAIKVDPELEDYEEVIPNTVSQFWGYDENGYEVYEGDSVQGQIDEWGRIALSPAVLAPTVKSELHMIYDGNSTEVQWTKSN